jgi:hypothetical protein
MSELFMVFLAAFLSLWGDFPIGGLVELNKTLMANAIRHCRHLVNS